MVKPRKELLRISRTPLAEYEGRPGLRLDKNENLAPDPALVREVLARTPAQSLADYPDYGAFLKVLARWMRCRPENLLLTAGSDGAIKLVFEAYLEPGDEFVTLSPSFAMFTVYGKLFGGRAVEVPFHRDLSAPLERLLSAIGPRTKIVALASPNNPTGTMLAEADFLKVFRRAARFGALVLVDEAYYFFTRRTMRPHVLQHDNVVLTRTFSKACGLASLRLGFALARPELIRDLRKCQPIFDVNGLALRCAEHVIRHEGRIWRYAAEVEKGKAYLERVLPGLGLGLARGHGNFVLIDLKRNPEAVARRLRKRGVAVGYGYPHPGLATCLKVTVGPEKVMRSFVRLLRECL